MQEQVTAYSLYQYISNTGSADHHCYSYSYISPSLSKPSAFQAHGAIVPPRLFRNGCSCSHLDLISTTFEWETPSWLLNPRCSLILTPSHGLSILFPARAPVRVLVEGEPSLACLLSSTRTHYHHVFPHNQTDAPECRRTGLFQYYQIERETI